ncbi:MAG: hypothetical protein H6974_05735 [Gammaproteobacteria bacterium]|nr:hypothetical protein [Gammaproteobacteria bacterium]
MPTLIPIPTEQSTALTNLPLAVLALSSAIALYRIGSHHDPVKTRIWVVTFVCLALSATLGAVFHGFVLPDETHQLVWLLLSFCVIITISLFFVGAVYDARRFSLPPWLIPVVLGVGLVFFLFSTLVGSAFFLLLLYEAVAILYALASYARLAFKRSLPGAGSMAVGILFAIVAAIVQATGEATGAFRFTWIWQFDHNGVFHLIQMLSVIGLLAGLCKEFSMRDTKNQSPFT